MMIKNKKQLLALILSAVSVLLLFLPWVTFSGQTSQDFRAVVQEARQTGASVPETIENSLNNLNRMPLSIKKQARKMIQALSDGKLTTWEAIGFSNALTESLRGLKHSQLYSSAAQASMKTSRVFLNLYPGLFCATLLLGLGAFILRLRRGSQSLFGWVYAIFQAVLWLFFLIFCAELRGASQNLLGKSLNLRVTFFPVLAVALAFFGDFLAERVTQLLPGSGDSLETSTTSKSVWLCGCGRVNSDASAFCSECGKPKPAPKICPQCGQLVPPEKSFCGQCGAKLDDGEQASPAG